MGKRQRKEQRTGGLKRCEDLGEMHCELNAEQQVRVKPGLM